MRYEKKAEVKRGARFEAELIGQKLYFSPRPCKQGHISTRYTSNGNCVQCARINYKRVQ